LQHYKIKVHIGFKAGQKVIRWLVFSSYPKKYLLVINIPALLNWIIAMLL
jgi:hypothetical protein